MKPAFLSKLMVTIMLTSVFVFHVQGQMITITYGTHYDHKPYIPCYGYYDYGWSKVIYLNDFIGTTAVTIEKLAWEVYSNNNSSPMINQEIWVKEVDYNTWSNTAWPDPANNGWTLVWSGDVQWQTGWHEFDLHTPFKYTGTQNLAICWNNYDGSYTSNYAYFWQSYSTYSTQSVYRYGDGSFPLSGYYSNYVPMLRITGCPAPTTIEGHAYDGTPDNPLPGVEIGFLGDDPPYPAVMTDANGYYRFGNVVIEPEIPIHYDLYGFLEGMNYLEQEVTVVNGQTITVDWNMAPPLMEITPTVLEVTLNPNEYLIVPITITNGPTSGPLNWTSGIILDDTYGDVSLSANSGNVPPGESEIVNVFLDATGTEPGQVLTAEVIFTAQPNVSTTTVDVSMIIAGDPLAPIDGIIVELVDQATGQVDISWTDVIPGNHITFEYYLIYRNGSPIATTQNTVYIDFLPANGDYCYTVSVVYTQGESVPAGPECVSWYIPELCYGPDPVYGEVWFGDENVNLQLTMENCGEGILNFEFPGFDDPDFSNGFVTSVSPWTGAIPEGETMTVNITFDATGYPPSTYIVDLELMTNELPPDNGHMITCEMLVYTPATLYGSVIDCDDSSPIPNVTVTAVETTEGWTFMGETNAQGYYEFYVDEGTYDITFKKLSYDDSQVTGVVATAGQMTEVNNVLCETPYPVPWVLLDPNEADDAAEVTWSPPMGSNEIIYDDGTAENFFAWAQIGGAVAVKFTPAGYPAYVVGGSIYVGDGSFPAGAAILGSPMSVGIMDDDGLNGIPGTVLDSVGITCDNYGWVNFELNGATVENGDFYLVYWQTSVPPFSPPVGIDQDDPVVYRSYTQQPGSNNWMMSVFNDFMIRAIIEEPFYPEAYHVALVDNFDPGMGEYPWDGDLTIMGTNTNEFYVDNAWGALDPGFYAYAIQAIYESDNSVWTYSNIAAHGLDHEVTVNVSLCDDCDPSGAYVMLEGMNYPYQILAQTVTASGTAPFDGVINGIYNLTVNKMGYQPFEWMDYNLNSDWEVDIILQGNPIPPRNLYVDPLTSVATWDAPLNIRLELTDFENEPFLPPGWQSTSSGIGWERVTDGSSSTWTVPMIGEEANDYYLVVNDDQSPVNNGCCDYLITPMCDLREADGFMLEFLSYYDGAYGQQAYVEYSTDGGATWEVLFTVPAAFDWVSYEIDLSDISGPDGLSQVWFAFHADDGGGWASGWALDNICIRSGAAANVNGYHVFLDGNFVSTSDAGSYYFIFQNLTYGQTYTAAVAALYSCNPNPLYGCHLSEKIYYTFTSTFLYPPRNLGVDYIENTCEVPLHWNPPATYAGDSGGEIPPGLLGYNIYQDMELVMNVPHPAEWTPDDTVTWVHHPVDPGCYEYTVTADYDLTEYGFPGQTGESMHDGSDSVCVDWDAIPLPFFETWDQEAFDFNGWSTTAGTNNWVVSSQNGNPDPSAQFNWDPDPGAGYAVSLTSAPLNADLYTVGNIWLDFHYFLNNRHATGDEMLTVEVYDGNDWNQVFSINNTNSFDWTPVHLDITDFAMGRVFMVRFTAMGENSFDIINWNVDNIHVYRQCGAPSELDGEYYWNGEDDFGAEISWVAPEIPATPGGWIRWDNGTIAQPVGLAEGGDWSAAIRWDAGEFSNCEGMLLTAVQLAPNEEGFDYIVAKIWQGAGAGTLLWESGQESPTGGIWNEYTIDPPVAVDVFDEIWIGYTIVGQEPNTFPASMDGGPAIAGYGDKISLDGVTWENASDFGFNGNWNIAALYGCNLNSLYGFNIYRMGPDENEYSLIDFVAYEEGVNNFSSWDSNDNYLIDGYPYEVCYQVTAVWESETDYCESMPASRVNPTDDYICVLVTDLGIPVALCQDVTTAADENCVAFVTPEQVDNGSYNPAGGEVTLTLTPPGPYPLGNTDVILTASNGSYEDTCSATITVEDNTPPVLTANSDTMTLWPPNLQYATYMVGDLVSSVWDNCASLSLNDVNIVQGTSDEPEAGGSCGNKPNDIIIAFDCKSIQLRKERCGGGNGRVYTIHLALDDEYGNTGTAVRKVYVPISLQQAAIEDEVAYKESGNCDNKSSFAVIQGDDSKKNLELTVYPNPLNKNTTFRFTLDEQTDVRLEIMNSMGQVVDIILDKLLPPGEQQIIWDTEDLPSGLYFYHLTANGEQRTENGKLMVVR